MDGIDIRIASELSKYWNLRFVSDRSSPDSWSFDALDAILDGKSDLALCSAWHQLSSYQILGLSTFVDYQCGTILVRAPTVISSSLYIYYALSIGVWTLIIMSLTFTAIVLTVVARYQGVRLRRWTSISRMFKYEDPIRSMLDLVSITSNQSILKMPTYATFRLLFIRFRNYILQT